ncbi:MAG: class I SAM-dependent methyltransferase [Akkermansiaceae bacterium]|nr:class I SAM-dependent methyltransferase [Akkermansiaceae bacterium]
MLIARSRYQGVWNIIRFNWPLFLVALLTIVTSLICAAFVPHPWNVLFRAGGLLAFGSVILSLVTSWMIYDRSSLYDLTWLRHFSLNQESCIVNLSAGFDETSEILKIRVPAEVIAMDFYDPVLHSEPSIRRARGVYSPSPELLKVTTSSFPQPDESVDLICMILSAHEVRKSDERTLFLAKRVEFLSLADESW